MHAFQHSNYGCFAVSALHSSGSEEQKRLIRPSATPGQHTDLQLTPLQCQVLVLVLSHTMRRFSVIKGGHVSTAFNKAVPHADLRLQSLVCDRLSHWTAFCAMLGECRGSLWWMWPHIFYGSCGGWLNRQKQA